MENLFSMIDKYVKLSYGVRKLNAKMNKLPDFMFASGVESDYTSLGFEKEFVEVLNNSTDSKQIREYYNKVYYLVEGMRIKIYDDIHALSKEEKLQLYDYLMAKVDELSLLVGKAQSEYLETVMLIEQAEKQDDAYSIRSLGKVAKSQYSRYYELDSFKDAYTYLGCYMSSMVNRKRFNV